MQLYYHSPIGLIELRGDSKGLQTCSFVREQARTESAGTEDKNLMNSAPQVLKQAWLQLDEYFKGKRKKFSVELNLEGTEFQKKVWAELQKIPYGQIRSYREIARSCDHPLAFRAVGGANHRNPVVIFVPCHRVIGADGSLTGFGAGLWRKKWLLQHEKKYSLVFR